MSREYCLYRQVRTAGTGMIVDTQKYQTNISENRLFALEQLIVLYVLNCRETVNITFRTK